MNGMRILGVVCAGVLASSLGTLAACGGAPESKETSTAQAVSAASVSIALFDENGTRVGEGSGVLIAPRLVLTSGHLISGKYKWVVKSADGKQQANGSRGMTYDWRKYDSDKAHPRRHDVGVIHLDDSIKLSAYPKLVGEASADGSKATRVRGTGGAFQQLDATLAKFRSSPNAWLADAPAGETLDTGGAVYDARGILGIVSGRGKTTGKLYVARVDGLTKWLAPKVACAGGATGVRTYAGPAVDKSKEICEDAGTGASSSGGAASASGGNPSSGGPGGESGGSCDGNNDGVCSGNCGTGGTNGSNPGGSNTGGSVPGGDGTPGTNGGGASSSSSSGSDGSNPGGSNTGGSVPGGDGTPGTNGGGASSSSSSGSDGANPGGSNTGGSVPGGDGTPGTNSGGAGGSETSSGGNGGTDGSEACQGPSDNPDVCPPEPNGCVGPTCGGGQPDDSIEYGDCACGSSGGDDGIYLR